MALHRDPASELGLARTVIEVGVRVALFAALAGWCVWIALPFIVPLLWGVILGVSLHPAHELLARRLGGRKGLAAWLLALVGLLLVLGPLGFLLKSLVENAAQLATRFGGDIALPPPPPQLASVPLVGEWLSNLWHMATLNLGAAISQIAPQLKIAAGYTLRVAAGTGLSLLQFVGAIVIAALLLTNSGRGGEAAGLVATRLIGPRGPELLELAEATIRSVTKGLLGTALIQALLAGVGLVVAGVPLASLLTLIVFVLCVVQLGPALVMLPAVVWVFYHADLPVTLAFLAWALFVMLIDNFVRPWLMSRDGRVPLLIILVGVLGGLLAHGLIGLFLGPVVFALGYEFLRAWVKSGGRRAPPVA